MRFNGECIDYIWQYSRHYGNLLLLTEKTATELSYQIGLLQLFNITEMVIKDSIKNYDIKFVDAINELKKQHLINKPEHKFLNNSKTGIRTIRNIFSHNNLSKYYFTINNDNSTQYPFDEDT